MGRRLLPLIVLLLVSACTEPSESRQPAARFEPTSVDLGAFDWSLGRPGPTRLILFNTGDVSLSLESLDVDQEGWSVAPSFDGPMPLRLDPGVGLGVTVEFVGEPVQDAAPEVEVTANLSAPSSAFSEELLAFARFSLEVDCDADDDGYPGHACGGPDCDDQDPAHSPETPELCNGLDENCDGLLPGEHDGDGDGFLACAECDDAAPTVHPGADELCDGLDTDCDPSTNLPEGELDYDTDGFLACAECDDGAHHNAPGNVELCDGLDNDCDGAPAAVEVDDDGDGQTECDGDCDDADATRRRFIPELCNGVDEDCDGVLPAEEIDQDLDGFLACSECDDQVASTYPGAPELCNGTDDDCDGELGAAELDADGDGFTPCDGDCDDTSSSVAPGLAELECDGLDTDCDGSLSPVEEDLDGDGFAACLECDDGVATTHPGAPELCNALDDDCDGQLGPLELDSDLDGHLACADCDDGQPLVFPGAPEGCDGIDTDCDGSLGPNELDDDGDGLTECGGDCDDTSASVRPGAPEVCNDVDDDCDGQLEEDFLRVPEDHPTIQMALDHRVVGDLVCVAAGDYYEELLLTGSPAVVVGRAGSALTSVVGYDYLDGPLVLADSLSTTVSLQGLTLRHASRALSSQAAELALTDVVVSDILNFGPIGSPVYVTDAVVTLEDVVFDGLVDIDGTTNTATFQNCSVSASGLTVVGCVAGPAALAIISADETVIEDLLVDGNQAGYGVGISGGELVLSGATFVDGSGGGLHLWGIDSASIDEIVASGHATHGISVSGSAVSMSHVEASSNCGSVPSGILCGGLLLSASASVQLTHVRANGNLMDGVRVGGGTEVWIDASTATGSSGSGLAVSGGSYVEVTNSDISSNGSGVTFPVIGPPGTLVTSHTNIGGNGVDVGPGIPFFPGLDGNLSVDPQYLDISSADPLDWDLHLSAASPLIDAGSGLDPDGSPADIGAFGGPNADLWDLDGDGWPSWWQPGAYEPVTYPALGLDCDDRDPDVGPPDC